MFTIPKKNGQATSSAGAPKKGEKGRLEFWVEHEGDDNFSINFNDFGNYGRLRWWGKATFNNSALNEAIVMLQGIRAGGLPDTHRQFNPQPEPQPEAEAQPADDEPSFVPGDDELTDLDDLMA